MTDMERRKEGKIYANAMRSMTRCNMQARNAILECRIQARLTGVFEQKDTSYFGGSSDKVDHATNVTSPIRTQTSRYKVLVCPVRVGTEGCHASVKVSRGDVGPVGDKKNREMMCSGGLLKAI